METTPPKSNPKMFLVLCPKSHAEYFALFLHLKKFPADAHGDSILQYINLF